jgi:hypothetical protein
MRGLPRKYGAVLEYVLIGSRVSISVAVVVLCVRLMQCFGQRSQSTLGLGLCVIDCLSARPEARYFIRAWLGIEGFFSRIEYRLKREEKETGVAYEKDGDLLATMEP